MKSSCAGRIALSAEAQLPFVEKYYEQWRGKLTSVGRLYQANYLPGTIDTVTKPDGVLSGKQVAKFIGAIRSRSRCSRQLSRRAG